jgi:hypothetical protein
VVGKVSKNGISETSELVAPFSQWDMSEILDSHCTRQSLATPHNVATELEDDSSYVPTDSEGDEDEDLRYSM